jgi:hypothetical protein
MKSLIEKLRKKANWRLNKQLLFLVLTAAITTVIALKPLFNSGMIAGHDIQPYMLRAQLFFEAFRQGQLPVRWINGVLPGTAHPDFQFYHSLFFYPTAVFQLIGISYVTSVYLTLATTVLLGWFSMYKFIKLYFDPLAAVAAATLFIFTPYRFSQLYVRASLGEFLATSLIPFAFWGVSLIFKTQPKQQQRGFAMLAVSLAAILVAHQPTLLMILVPIVFWIMFNWVTTQSNLKMIKASLACLSAVGLSAFLILPLIFEQQFVRFSLLKNSYYDFHIHFATIKQVVYSAWGYGISQAGTGDQLSFQLGLVNWLMLAIALGLIIKFKKNRHFVVFFSLVTLFAVSMATQISEPIWERVSALSFLQFPWRFLAISTFGTSVLAGFVFSLVSKMSREIKVTATVFFMLALLITNLNFIKPITYLDRGHFSLDNPQFHILNQSSDGTFTLERGYLPVWVEDVNSGPNRPLLELISGKGELTVTKDNVTQKEFSAYLTEPGTVRVVTPYFPGWVAEISSGAKTQIMIPNHDNPAGLMDISLPPGNYQVSLRLNKTPVRQIADATTLLTILGLSYYFSAAKIKQLTAKVL